MKEKFKKGQLVKLARPLRPIRHGGKILKFNNQEKTSVEIHWYNEKKNTTEKIEDVERFMRGSPAFNNTLNKGDFVTCGERVPLSQEEIGMIVKAEDTAVQVYWQKAWTKRTYTSLEDLEIVKK